MITKRIIPCLDVRNGRVVKGTNFQGLRDVSSPVELGQYYSANGADELVAKALERKGECQQGLVQGIKRLVEEAQHGRA